MKEGCQDQTETEKCFYEPCVDPNVIHKDLCILKEDYQTLDNCTMTVLDTLDHLNGEMQTKLTQVRLSDKSY